MKPIFVFLSLALISLSLSSCALVQTPINLIQGLAGAVARTVDTDENSLPPSRNIHVEPLNNRQTDKTPADANAPAATPPIPAPPTVASSTPNGPFLVE